MRIGGCALWMVAVCAAVAQTGVPAATPTASIAGVVEDVTTGEPLADYVVSTTVQGKYLRATSDAQGHYRLADLPLGSYQLVVRAPRIVMPRATRTITLVGNPVEHLDFKLTPMGAISGRVVDDAKEPAPGVTVFLVAREYYAGGLGYFVKNVTKARARGEYEFEGVETGRPFLVLAEKQETALNAHSDAPADPKLRSRVLAPAFYPNSPDAEGGLPILLRPGERREAVDIVLKRSAAYCVAGTLEGMSGPAALRFWIEGQWAKLGASNGGGVYMELPSGQTLQDGKIRHCGLPPGTYRIVAERPRSQAGKDTPLFGVAEVTVTKQDLEKVRVIANVGQRLDGEVIWADREAKAPDGAKLDISLLPLRRMGALDEHTAMHSDVPGTFVFAGLVMDEYGVRASVTGPGLYVKDVTYGNASVQRLPVTPGSAPAGATLRVVVAADGATLTASVHDKDGVAVVGQRILLMPAQVASEAELAGLLISGETDQAGQFTSQALAPGKYYVAATGDTVYPTPESIGRLWRARNRFKEVDLGPNGTAQMSLEPVKLDL